MEYRSNSPPELTPLALAAINTGATSAGLKPGERYTADTPCPSIRLASKAPATKRTCGSSCCSTASCGGAERVSATVTWAPQRTHQRAIARPEAPKPRTKACWPCSGSAALLPTGQPAGTGGSMARSFSEAPGAMLAWPGSAGALPSATGCASSAMPSAVVLVGFCEGVSARPVSAKMRATKAAASCAAVSAGASAGAGAAAGTGSGIGNGATTAAPASEAGAAGTAGTCSTGSGAGRCGSKGVAWFIAVSGSTGPPGTAAW